MYHDNVPTRTEQAVGFAQQLLRRTVDLRIAAAVSRVLHGRVDWRRVDNELASTDVAAQLIRLGYKAVALKGGIADWLAANLPVETKEAPKQATPEPGALKG